MSGNSYWCFKWPEDSLAEVHTEHDHRIGSLSHKVTHLWKQNENKNKISKWEKGEGCVKKSSLPSAASWKAMPFVKQNTGLVFLMRSAHYTDKILATLSFLSYFVVDIAFMYKCLKKKKRILKCYVCE